MDLKFDKSGQYIEQSTADIKSKVVAATRIGEVEIDKGKIPDFTAGMYLIDLLPYNPGKPKFVFSAATETKDFIKYTELLSSRFLGNDLFFAADYSKGIEGLKKLCKPLDSYLRKRQVEICQKQQIEILVELKGIVKNMKSGEKCSRCDCDKELIPDNPTDTNGEKWTLRTLFPKQINSIEANIDVEENKKHILEVLKADWRKLMKNWKNGNGILTHPKPMKKDVFENCMNIAEILDFEVEDKAIKYKQLKRLPDFDKSDKVKTNSLRDKIIINEHCEDEYKISYLPTENLNSVKNYFESTSLVLCNEEIVNNWNLELKGFCENYGIYPIDIVYISHIAHLNSSRANNKQPCFGFDTKKPEKISFIWDYNTNVVNPNEDKVLQKCREANEDIQTLKDEGLSDICKIVCWRYRGEFELCLGNIRYLILRDLQNNDYYVNEYNAKHEEIDVTSVIKILKLQYNNGNQTIRYKVTISKPSDI